MLVIDNDLAKYSACTIGMTLFAGFRAYGTVLSPYRVEGPYCAVPQ